MKPLTCLGMTLRTQNGQTPETINPGFTLSTSDASLWEFQLEATRKSEFSLFSPEDPFLEMHSQLTRVLQLWRVYDYRRGLPLKFGNVLEFTRDKSLRFFVLPVSFRPEGGNTYLDLRLFGGGPERIKLGPFDSHASAEAWVLTAISTLTVKGAKLKRGPWYRVFTP